MKDYRLTHGKVMEYLSPLKQSTGLIVIPSWSTSSRPPIDEEMPARWELYLCEEYNFLQRWTRAIGRARAPTNVLAGHLYNSIVSDHNKKGIVRYDIFYDLVNQYSIPKKNIDTLKLTLDEIVKSAQAGLSS